MIIEIQVLVAIRRKAMDPDRYELTLALMARSCSFDGEG